MQSTFLNLSHFRIILLPLAITLFANLSAKQPHESLLEKIDEAYARISTRFSPKIEKKQRELFAQADLVKKDPLYNELEIALDALHKDPVYDFYSQLKEACAFIDQLKEHHRHLVGSELLQQLNSLVDRLHRYEQFTSFRATLKKERVALIEVAEEKDLLGSLEKILTYQEKDLKELSEKERERVTQLPSYLHVEQVQKKYLQTPVVKKFLIHTTQLYDLLVQQEIALLKNKEYQQLLYTHELRAIPGSIKESSDQTTTSKIIIALQHELHTISIDELL